MKKLPILAIAIFVIFPLLPDFSFAQDVGNPNPLIELPRIPSVQLPTRPTPQPLQIPDQTEPVEKFDHGSILKEYIGENIIKESQKSVGGKGGLGETPVSRDSQSNQKISIPNPLGVSTFADLIAKINRWLIIIGGPILTLFILIGAFQIMTAGGTPENITKGRHTITWAIIGYGLLLISTGIAYLIKDILGAQ